jgi:peptidoglycan/LPS O-acetylase OafA/YrhL
VLDGWRGLAVLLVLFGHFVSSNYLNSGRLGVELFFVLSGRLMAQILFIERVSLRSFYLRRFARIFPALFIFLLFVGAWIFSSGRDFSAVYFGRSVLLISNYYFDDPGRVVFIDHLWSLCVEEHSYIVLGLIALFVRRSTSQAGILMAALAIGAIAWGGYLTWMLGLDYYSVYWRSDVRAASVLIGALVYLYASFLGEVFDHFKMRPGTFMFLAVLSSFNIVPDPVKYSFGTLMIALSLISLERAVGYGTKIEVVFSSRFLCGLGAISFSLYLWQQPFYKLVQSPEDRGVYLVCAIIFGIASYRLIEQPFRRRLGRRISLLLDKK